MDNLKRIVYFYANINHKNYKNMTFFTNSKRKITDLIDDCTTMDDCGRARSVIDDYENDKPKEKEFIKEVRNSLCDKTFEVFANTRTDKGRY